MPRAKMMPKKIESCMDCEYCMTTPGRLQVAAACLPTKNEGAFDEIPYSEDGSWPIPDWCPLEDWEKPRGFK